LSTRCRACRVVCARTADDRARGIARMMPNKSTRVYILAGKTCKKQILADVG